MDKLQKSMRPVAGFIFENTDTVSKRLCLFAGHFLTASVVTTVLGESTPVKTQSQISYADPSAIVAAGYECDQVADDYNLSTLATDASGEAYKVRITPKTTKTRFRDMVNYIKMSGLRVAKMRITDLNTSNPTHDIFNSEIEVSASAIGSKGGSDYIQLSECINPANFLQNFIEVNLEDRNLLLDETTLVFLEIPARAKFSIDFTLA